MMQFVNLRNNGGSVSGSQSSFKVIIETKAVLLNLNVSDLKRKIVHLCGNKLSLDHNSLNVLVCNSSILE